MKHLFTSSLLLLALLLPTTVFAYDFVVDGIYYNVNGNEATVTYCSAQFEIGDGDEIYIIDIYSDYSGHVTIPASVINNGTTYNVTAIGDYAFIHCNEMTSITIPNSITSIGICAFFGCGLTSIDIPDSVKTIGSQAFCCCENLSSISLSNSITEISFGTFTACHNLPHVTIPNSVTIINESAFHECTGLANIEIPSSVTSIRSGAFYGCTSLKDIIIPKSVTSIGECVLYFCEGLESICIEDENPNYDSRDNCNAIIETASNTLIQGCKKTIIPNTITNIGQSAFGYCTGLNSIIIPNSVTYIGYGVFFGCNSLTNVYSYIVNPEKVFLDSSVFSLPDESASYFNRTLHVPIGTLAAYQADSRWSDYFGSILETEPTSFIRGDVDCDDQLTISDVIALIDLLLSGNY